MVFPDAGDGGGRFRLPVKRADVACIAQLVVHALDEAAEPLGSVIAVREHVHAWGNGFPRVKEHISAVYPKRA